MTRYRKLVIISCLFVSLFCPFLYAGGGGEGETSSSTEESIPVELSLRGAGKIELFVLRKGAKTYLPMVELFKFLHVNINVSPDRRNVEGFFLSKDTAYSIDFNTRIAAIQGRSLQITDEQFIISTEDIYLESELLADIFGIKSVYNSRRLTVLLSSQREMPIVSIAKRQRNRERMLKAQEIPVPTLFTERSPFFFGGARLNYRLNSLVAQHRKTEHNYQLGFGSHILGGDLQGIVHGQVAKKINEDNVTAFIRYPFYDGTIVRQVILGDLPQDFDILYIGIVRGAEITNRPAPRRLTLATESFTIDAPGSSEVELYQGGRLVSYYPSNSSGIYKFQLGIPYGNSDIELRAFDDWGGLEIQRYRFNVSQLMIPPGEFQYSIKGGELRRRKNDYYAKARVDYGASSSLTVGLDAQYIDLKNDGQQFYPAITAEAALRVTPGILGEFSFSPLLASKFLLNGSFPSQAYVTFAHYWFKRSSPLNLSHSIEQTSFSFSIPFYFPTYGIVLSGLAEQNIYEALRRRALTPRIEGYSKGVRVSLSMNLGRVNYTNLIYTDFWTTRLGTSFRVPYNIILSAAAQYDHKAKKMQSAQISASMAIGSKLLLIASYNRSWLPSVVSAFIQLTYDLPFLHIEARGSRIDGNYQYNQVLSGSALTSASFSDFFFDNRLRLGRSVLYFRTFLDQNGNGVREDAEQFVPDINVKVFSSQASGKGFKAKYGLISANTEAYQTYVGYVTKQNYEDPHWVPRFGAVSVMVEPNIMKVVDLPIVVGGVINGKVMIKGATESIGAEGVTVALKDGAYSAKTRTFSTGEFSFNGVPPGRYVISISIDELAAAGLRPLQTETTVEVRPVPNGDVIDNINFEVVER